MVDKLRRFSAQPLRVIRQFIQLEIASSIILFLSAVIALLISNSPWAKFYYFVFNDWRWLTMPIQLWINDGLMTLFFVLVGLEIKRELIAGELNTISKRVLPCIGALGGMIVPALLFSAINWHDPLALKGWAIPAATDIAFALGAMQLLGSRIPVALKIFLMALAIMDDLGAVIIITFFYSSHLLVGYIMVAALLTFILFYLNYKQIYHFGIYAVVGLLLWVCVLLSGIHPTVAGVIFAFAVPLTASQQRLPLQRLEQQLHPWVAYGIMPLFAFANAGINFSHIGLADWYASIPLGIIVGLFIGKQLGVWSFCAVVIKLKWAQLPAGVSWQQFYGMAILCGIGFTMSLFIGNLAYQGFSPQHINYLRLGVMTGSILSGLLGYGTLRFIRR